tara:strand:+ start:1041 stop:1481 length:441 start_codon:yes stop_codon:yes gene_type:complete
MKFTVREISDKDITIDFPDGTWAVVPAKEGALSRAELCEWILEFNPQQANWQQMPFHVGDIIEFEDPTNKDGKDDTPPDTRKMGYREMRKALYPPVINQMDAAYWARNGDPHPQREIDAAIAEVKKTIPKDTPPMTRAELSEFLLK